MKRIIGIDNLAVVYGEHLVLKDINLQVEKGERLIVLGGSGCGKSTLLKSIIGLTPIHAGRIEIFDAEPADLPELERDALLRRLGVMFQYGALLNSLTVGENLSLPLEMHTDLSPALVEDIVRTRLHLVGLDHAYALLPAELSGGMRKRAALARAMVLDPEILFCDEPGAGLDPVTAAEIDHLLLTVNQSLGITLIIVTHELLSIERLDGRLIMLDQGEVVFTGTVDQAKTSDLPVVAHFFNPGASSP